MLYIKDIMHIHIQMKAENIYMASIYMYARLGLGFYGPYMCIYGDIEACVQSGAYTSTMAWILLLSPESMSSAYVGKLSLE